MVVTTARTRPTAALVEQAVRLFDAYSLLLLYSGSCTPDRYASTVRVDMMAADPAFSGEWAADYRAIPTLLRRIRVTHPDTAAVTLTRAARFNHRVHMSVARRLVPDGVSLLKQASYSARGTTAAENSVFDDYFLVRRARVCEHTFTAQAIRRLLLVSDDIAAHGLHGSTGAPQPLVPADREAFDHIDRTAGELLGWLSEIFTTRKVLRSG
jgi:hypothetical protein